MLKIVKSLVDRTPEIPFGEFYLQYIMKIQDEAIDREVKTMLHNSKTNVSSMSILIDNTYKAVKKNDSSCDIAKCIQQSI
jgi:hypothetical protein